LPVRTYSAADGLPSNFITAIPKDSRGYLWIATREGLSHFDSYEFTNHTCANGLPRNSVTDFLETRAGEYWTVTSAGAARFEPNAPGTNRFRVFAPPPVR
jgi:ligand-binding sensor domain-containing protein